MPASADPVANFLQVVNKLQFVVSLPPTLKKDVRQIQLENFYRHTLFNGKSTSGPAIKNEILKLNNCSRELIQHPPTQFSVAHHNKELTYEQLN